MSSPLSTEEKRILLRVAREALESAVGGSDQEALTLESIPSRLKEAGACFVTLTKEGALRGCIGTLNACRPLIEDVRLRAVDAARNDPRFAPIEEEEVPALRIEISVLSKPLPLVYDQPEEIPKRLRVGIDGVIVLQGNRRATFLPQVWERVPEPEMFLKMLCQKAGLAPDAWREGGLQILTYQVEDFGEEIPPD